MKQQDDVIRYKVFWFHLKNDQRTKDEYLKMFITYHFDTLFKLVYILNSFTYGAYLKLSILIISKFVNVF